MYTPFLLNPRTSPSLVSATVVVSEAMTLPCPQGTATGRGLVGATVAASPSRSSVRKPNMSTLPKTQPYSPIGRVFFSKKNLLYHAILCGNLSQFHPLFVLWVFFGGSV